MNILENNVAQGALAFITRVVAMGMRYKLSIGLAGAVALAANLFGLLPLWICLSILLVLPLLMIAFICIMLIVGYNWK